MVIVLVCPFMLPPTSMTDPTSLMALPNPVMMQKYISFLSSLSISLPSAHCQQINQQSYHDRRDTHERPVDPDDHFFTGKFVVLQPETYGDPQHRRDQS